VPVSFLLLSAASSKVGMSKVWEVLVALPLAATIGWSLNDGGMSSVMNKRNYVIWMRIAREEMASRGNSHNTVLYGNLSFIMSLSVNHIWLISLI